MTYGLRFYINGAANDTFAKNNGIRMGDGFVETLTELLTMKELVTSESRLEAGKRVMEGQTLYPQAREITLTFAIHGDGATCALREKSMWSRREALVNLFLSREVGISIPDIDANTVYWLRYLGKSNQYALSLGRTDCRVAMKFLEADPSQRLVSAPSRPST